MTAPPPAGAAGRAWRLAVPISVASAVLGLGRELVVLHRVGLSESNDLLQYYLSVTYTISLLGDAIRLAVLNLLQTGALAGALAATLLAGLAAGLPITLWYLRGGPSVDLPLLAAAGLAGILNLLTLALLMHRQRSGRFLPAHVITALPNVLIFAGVALAMRLETAAFLRAVVLLFLAAPVLQIALLLLLRTDPGPAAARGRLGADLRLGLGQMALHGVGAVGTQAGQVLIRTALASYGPGLLTVFVLLTRAVDTLRAVLLETLIGSRLADWAAGRGRVPRLLDPVHLAPGALAVVVGLTGLAAWGGRTDLTTGGFAAFLAVVLLPGAWLAFLQRAGYFFLNATGVPQALILRLGLLDAGAAALMALAAVGAGFAPLPLVWMFFVVRVAWQVWLIRAPGRADVRG